MTENCMECRFRRLCEQLGYELNCADDEKCDHFDAYLEGYEAVCMVEG